MRYFLELIFVMTEKEIRTRYKHTILGFLWVLLNPLLQMIVMGFIFNFFVKEKVEYYYFFLFVGLLIWDFFSLSLSKATPSIVYERSIIKKAKFPAAVIPLSLIFSGLFHTLLAFLLFIIPLSFIRITNVLHLFVIVPALLLLLAITVGITLITSSLNVKYRDVNFFVQAGLTLCFYLTPVLYPLSFVPKELLLFWYINPLTAIIEMFRYALLNRAFPAIEGVIISTIIAVIVLSIGIYMFSKEEKFFDDWV